VKSEKPLLVIFIPAYNEGEVIAETITRVKSIYHDNHDFSYRTQILVVDDGSTDNTYDEAVKSGCDKIFRHPRNKGLGGATRTALELSYKMGADVALKLDADLQHAPEDIDRAAMVLFNDEADICWGYRVMRYERPFIRQMGNKFFTGLMNWMTKYKITDAQTGMMAFNREYLSMFELLGNYNPPQQLLIDAYKKGMRYAEVPVDFFKRESGKSFVSFKYPFFVFMNIARMLAYGNPFKVFSSFAILMLLLSVVSGVSMAMFDNFITEFIKSQKLMPTFFFLGMQGIFISILLDIINNKFNHLQKSMTQEVDIIVRQLKAEDE